MGKKYVTAVQHFWKGLPTFYKILFSLSILVALFLVGVGVLFRSIFTYDQARDALQAYSIWHDKDIKILGPETDIPGVFHGVLWYYVLAALYGIGKFPEFVITAFSALSIGTIFIVGVLAHRLFKNNIITTTTIVLYACSPLFQTTTRWVSNPIVALFVTPILLLLLWNFFERQKISLAFWIGVCFGVIIQGEFAFVLLLLAIPIYWFFFRLKIRFVGAVCFLVGLLLATSSFFLAEVKFKAQGIKGMGHFFHNSPSHANILTIVLFIWGRVLDFFSIVFYPFPRMVLAIMVVLFVIFLFTKLRTLEKKPLTFLLIWSSTLLIFLLFHTGISTSYFLFYPFFVPIVLLVSFSLYALWSKKVLYIAVLFGIIVFQVYSSYTFLATNTSPLPAQQGTTLSLVKEVIAYSYENSHNRPFTIVTITNPLFINTTWAYAYTTYGLPKYGYLPYFAGRSQKNNLGYLPEKQFATEDRYLIIEPTIGIPDVYITQIIQEEDLVSQVVSTKHIGTYIIEKRKLHLK